MGSGIMMTQKEIAMIKTKAADYAKRFLMHKYALEYAELYKAYCDNRGVNVTRSNIIPPTDERIVKGNNN